MSAATAEGRLSWQDDAACRGMGTDVFFPLPGGRAEAAQRVCSRCPVRSWCADYGRDEQHGIWGGVLRDPPSPERTPYGDPVVREALQPRPQEPYRSQRTANNTATTPTEAPAMSKNTPAETPAATTDETRAKSAVSKDGDHKCPSCKTTKPVTKYPTVRNAQGEYVRSLDECRPCRDERRAARKAEKEAAKAIAA